MSPLELYQFADTARAGGVEPERQGRLLYHRDSFMAETSRFLQFTLNEPCFRETDLIERRTA